MSPINAAWVADPEQRTMIGSSFGRGSCRDLVCKMVRGGEQFTNTDWHSYEWLMENMIYFLQGTIYEKLIPGFKMVLTHAWKGGEKLFFDLELLRKLVVALSVYLDTSELEQGMFYGALSSPFTLDKRTKDP